MTRKSRQRLRMVALSAALCGALAMSALVMGAWREVSAATTGHVVVDRYTGLAIYGFDPVAYFTDGAALPGRETLELSLGGAAWRFRNEGNLAAFADDPEIYMPRFGGHDPVAIGHGIARAGHPQIWAIHGERLFLFYSEEARREFVADPQAVVERADARWPALSRTLSP